MPFLFFYQKFFFKKNKKNAIEGVRIFLAKAILIRPSHGVELWLVTLGGVSGPRVVGKCWGRGWEGLRRFLEELGCDY